MYKKKGSDIMKTLNYTPMDKSTWGYDMLDKVNTLFVYGHPYSNTCENCWKSCKLPDKKECDDNGNHLANGIYGNMLIQMKLGNVEKIYGTNCYNDIGNIDEEVLQGIAVFRIVR